jgi:hypothetical protein
MKKIHYMAFATLAAFCAIASAATTVPVQFLNPTGSSAGQTIVSTGAGTAPVWGGVGLNGISAIGSNTVLANATGASAAPTAFSMPSCSASSSALTWTTNTGFACNTAVNATTISGATQYDPIVGTGAGAVGSISPGTAGGIFASNGTSAYPSFQTAAALGLTNATKLRYFNTSGQSIPNITNTTITGWTKDFDNNNDFNASTGTFTAPVTGFYLVSAQITFSYTTAATNNFQLSELQSAGNSLTWTCAIPTGATNPTCFGSTIASLSAGNTVNIKIYQNSGSAQTLSVSTYINTVSIARIY